MFAKLPSSDLAREEELNSAALTTTAFSESPDIGSAEEKRTKKHKEITRRKQNPGFGIAELERENVVRVLEKGKWVPECTLLEVIQPTLRSFTFTFCSNTGGERSGGSRRWLGESATRKRTFVISGPKEWFNEKIK